MLVFCTIDVEALWLGLLGRLAKGMLCVRNGVKSHATMLRWCCVCRPLLAASSCILNTMARGQGEVIKNTVFFLRRAQDSTEFHVKS